jgi:hypothetical protein
MTRQGLEQWLEEAQDEAIRKARPGTRRRARLIAERAALEALEIGDARLCDQIMAFHDAVLAPRQPRDARGRFMWMPSTMMH